jgi:DNA-binding transcriptional regulator YiaG
MPRGPKRTDLASQTARLQRLRNRLKKSQQGMADYLNINLRTWTAWELGQIEVRGANLELITRVEKESKEVGNSTQDADHDDT